jgi:HSP20 family protein
MANVGKQNGGQQGAQPQGAQPQGAQQGMQPQGVQPQGAQPQGAQPQQGGQPQQGQRELVRREPSRQLSRDPFQLLMRDPFQMMREMMVNPFRFLQMSPWGFFGRDEMEWNPSFEIQETDDAFLFKADLPGIRNEDLEISLMGNQLVISGKREQEHEQTQGQYHTYERSYGNFTRSFALPESADLDKVQSDLKDGVLTLVVPKKAGSSPQRRKIQIGSGSKA